jgi:hypothetical protein
MDMMNRANGEALFQLDVQLVNFRLRAKIAFKTWNREYVNALNWLRVWSKSITGIAESGETVPHDSHRAIAQLGSRAKVEADHNLDGGGPGPGSSDNLDLDLVSAAAANAPSLIKRND